MKKKVDRYKRLEDMIVLLNEKIVYLYSIICKNKEKSNINEPSINLSEYEYFKDDNNQFLVEESSTVSNKFEKDGFREGNETSIEDKQKSIVNLNPENSSLDKPHSKLFDMDMIQKVRRKIYSKFKKRFFTQNLARRSLFTFNCRPTTKEWLDLIRYLCDENILEEKANLKSKRCTKKYRLK